MTLNYEKVIRWPIPEVVQSHTRRDTMLYALGVGAATTNPVEPDSLHFVYEKNLVALPTMAVVLAPEPFWIANPETGIDWKRLLHGEQRLTIHKPLPVEARLVGRAKVDEIFDKGPEKGAILVMSKQLFEADSGDLIATVGYSAFLRGDGGCGGNAGSAPQPHPIPERAPDLTLDLITRPEQALIYRLSGDYNPLHVDAAFARTAGFDKPILHGLCSYGVVGRAAIQLLCGNQPERLRRFDVRFASPVFPGETIRTEVWHQAPGQAALRARVVERDIVVINNGCVEYATTP